MTAAIQNSTSHLITVEDEEDLWIHDKDENDDDVTRKQVLFNFV